MQGEPWPRHEAFKGTIAPHMAAGHPVRGTKALGGGVMQGRI